MGAEEVTRRVVGKGSSGGGGGGTHLHDLPDALLSLILSLVSDARSRNSASLVCQRWRQLERATRSRLTLRGNWRHLFLLPTCFPSLLHLDLSLLSPWGSPLPDLASLSLLRSFPSTLTSLTLYARDPHSLFSLPSGLPFLLHLKPLRWHQRPPCPPGHELLHLLLSCPLLSSLDLSSFYYWTEDLPAALDALCPTTTKLTTLDLLTDASLEGFKSPDLLSISAGCPLLRWLRLPTVFDPRYDDCIADDALLSFAAACPSLRTLRMVERRPIEADDDGDQVEAKVTPGGLEGLFGCLPELEDFEFDCGYLVKGSGVALEALKGRKMASLRLGGLQGVCTAGGLHLDGVAAIGGLRELVIRRCGDLTDAALAMIGRGCSRLERFELEGCKGVTQTGVIRMASSLRSTLIHVRISSCKNLDAVKTVSALEPIRDKIQSLHIDCVWQPEEEHEEEGAKVGSFSDDDDGGEYPEFVCDTIEEMEERCALDGQRMRKRRRYEEDGAGLELDLGVVEVGLLWCKEWGKLRRLSLWFPVGDLLGPLAAAGLESCPDLEEVSIKVEGDCRTCPKPTNPFFGLSSLMHYPLLAKMKLDLSNVIGYVWTAPMGHMDLSLWERFYLKGIEELPGLRELDYWPPQDRDVNQRSLSLPAAGLLSECTGLRKLFIHGTLHEHFMRFLLNIPNLRDVQILEDYYPAPDNDTSTEMRIDSCSRFEEALNRRRIPD